MPEYVMTEEEYNAAGPPPADLVVKDGLVKMSVQTIKVKYIQATKALPDLETGYAAALALNVTCTVFKGGWISALCTAACAAALGGEIWAKTQDPVVIYVNS